MPYDMCEGPPLCRTWRPVEGRENPETGHDHQIDEPGIQIWWVMMPRCRSEAMLMLSGCSVIKTFCICSPLG